MLIGIVFVIEKGNRMPRLDGPKTQIRLNTHLLPAECLDNLWHFANKLTCISLYWLHKKKKKAKDVTESGGSLQYL